MCAVQLNFTIEELSMYHYRAHKGTLSVVIFFISFVRNNISFVRNDFVCTKYYFVCTK